MDYLSYTRRMAEHSEMMDAMMAHHGIDRATAQSLDGELGWLTACAKCIFCPRPEACSRWLRGATNVAGPEAFCPNTAFFRECQRQDKAA